MTRVGKEAEFEAFAIDSLFKQLNKVRMSVSSGGQWWVVVCEITSRLLARVRCNSSL